jgi:maltose/moltooligosaccharide transporter
MFANYNLIAALAFLLPLLAKYTSRKFTHFIALVCGGLGLISIYFIQEPTAFTMEWLPMIGVGIAWASILSVPMRCYPVHYLLTKWAITWEF